MQNNRTQKWAIINSNILKKRMLRDKTASLVYSPFTTFWQGNGAGLFLQPWNLQRAYSAFVSLWHCYTWIAGTAISTFRGCGDLAIWSNRNHKSVVWLHSVHPEANYVFHWLTVVCLFTFRGSWKPLKVVNSVRHNKLMIKLGAYGTINDKYCLYDWQQCKQIMQYGSVFTKIVHDIISGSVIGHFILAIQFSRQDIAVGSRCPLWPGALGQLPHL